MAGMSTFTAGAAVVVAVLLDVLFWARLFGMW
jgi:hypothetical protein